MARKAIRGYSEKSYYENSTFKGIVATTDPLNEGNFAHMVNFDISDTGNSLKPRCGFLTTDFLLYTSEGYDTLKLKADTTIYFYEPSIQKYIFVDFSTFRFTSEELGDYTYSLNAYAIEFVSKIVEGHTNKHFIAERISNVDIDDLFSLFVLNEEDDYKNMRLALTRTKFKQTLAEHITDSYLISKYIIKHAFNDYTPYTWIEVYYRKEGSSYEDITYSDDTVVVSFVNTEDTVSIDPNNRNIASTKSIIPDPLQKIYPVDSKDLAYNQFPFIYAKDNTTGKYLTTTSKDLDITLTPHFLLQDFSDSRVWGYTYSFLSTRADTNLYSDTVWTSGLFDLKSNTNINNLYVNRLKEQLNKLSSFETNSDLVHLEDLVSSLSPTNVAANYFYWMYSSALADVNYLQFFELMSLYRGYLVKDTTTNDVDFVKSPIDQYLNRVNPSTYGYFTSKYVSDSVLIYVVPKIYNDPMQFHASVINGFDNLLSSLDNLFSLSYPYTYYTYNHTHKLITALNNIGQMPMNELVQILQGIDCSDLNFIITPLNNLQSFFNTTKNGVSNINGLNTNLQYGLFSGILFTQDKPKTLTELCTYLLENTHTNVIWKYMQSGINVQFLDGCEINLDDDLRAHQVIPNIKKYKTVTQENESDAIYYIYTADIPRDKDIELYTVGNTVLNGTGSYARATAHLRQYFFKLVDDVQADHNTANTVVSIPLIAPLVYNPDRTSTSSVITASRCLMDVQYWIPHNISTHTSNPTHFEYTNNILTLDMYNSELSDLRNRQFFVNGVSLRFNIIACTVPKTLYEYITTPYDLYNPEYLTNISTLYNTLTISLSPYPTYIPEFLTEQPTDIRTSNKWCVFHSEQGDRLVTWIANKVYVSEANDYYYFKESNKYAYPEKVLKVIQFKNTLLVFTTINLYSIYPYEDTIMVESGKDDEGNTQYVQNKIIYYATLPVLYNLMLTEQYIDAIQVFNQMVLFYSADGQLFMIKPTATIDNDTKFTIQYFNKSVNDILLNYVDYMNNRLLVYGVQDLIQDKTQVKIKVQVNINHIKIFYMYKDYTYILVYDVINNYFYVYDTMSFSNVDNILFTEDGDVYVTPTTLNANEDYLFFTIKNYVPNEMDNNNDEAIYHNFVDTPILSELDTGVLNLNNHLKKRFRDLYTVYKNISSTYLNYEVETFIDDIPAQVVLGDSLTVKATEVNGEVSYNYDCVEIKNTNDILKYNALFDFSLFTSNKMLTYYTNIPCLGKQFRLRLRFNSKGVYKLQSYGITFKEHQI